VSAVIALVTPRRIKASHRRRRRVASDHLLYILNNPLSGTDPTGYLACVGRNLCSDSSGRWGDGLGGSSCRGLFCNYVLGGGSNGAKQGAGATPDRRDESKGSGSSTIDKIGSAVSRMFVPNAQDLQARGEQGDWGDVAAGFGKSLVNKGIGIVNTGINATPAWGLYNQYATGKQIAVPELHIDNKQLSGAVAADFAFGVVTALLPAKAVGKSVRAGRAGGESLETSAPSMRQPASGTAPLHDNALVVRGGSGVGNGANTSAGIAKGTSIHPSGVEGFSAESANGISFCSLCRNVTHNQIGVTTVGQIRAAGGDVVSTAGVSRTHATVTGLSPELANSLLTPTTVNPIPAAERLLRP
jgi:hypothetical protein